MRMFITGVLLRVLLLGSSNGKKRDGWH